MKLIQLRFMRIVLWYIREQQVSFGIQKEADNLQQDINQEQARRNK